MSSSNSSTGSNFQTINSKSRSRSSNISHVKRSTRQSYITVTSTTKQTNLKTKYQSGKVNLDQPDDDLEDTSLTPCSKKCFFISFFLPCIGCYGFSQIKNKNRREKLWGIIMLISSFIVLFLWILAIIIFAVFY